MGFYEEKKTYFYNLYWKNTAGNPLEVNGNLDGSRVDLKSKSEFILGHISRPGNILDMGCGNGFLLKVICKYAPVSLVPFGVDFLEQSIEQAQEKIFPTYRENFIVGNVMEFESTQKFEYILIDPESVADKDIESYIEKCRNLLTPTGNIIAILHPDSRERMKKRKHTLPYIESLGKEEKNGDIYFIVF